MSGDSSLKAIGDAYRVGYDEAKADMLLHVNAAIRSCNWALEDAGKYGVGEDKVLELRLRIEELRRIRAVLTAIKPTIAGR